MYATAGESWLVGALLVDIRNRSMSTSGTISKTDAGEGSHTWRECSADDGGRSEGRTG